MGRATRIGGWRARQHPGSQGSRSAICVPAADEGTTAHARLAFRLGKLADKPANVTPEMEAAVEMVMDYLEGIALQNPGTTTEMYVEQPFTFPQSVVPPEECGGIADLVVDHPDDAEAWAIEFKFGMRPVEVERNPQLMFQATGLLRRRGLRKLNLVVIQPRMTWHYAGPIREWSCDAVDIAAFQQDVEFGLVLALRPDAPRVVG